VSVTHNVPTVVTFTGAHPLEEGDVVAFVPESDGGCQNALSAAGGVLDSSLSVAVSLDGHAGGGAGVSYVLCVAEAPPGGFAGGSPTAGSFDLHAHVTAAVVHEPPSVPPFPPPLSPPPFPHSPPPCALPHSPGYLAPPSFPPPHPPPPAPPLLPLLNGTGTGGVVEPGGTGSVTEGLVSETGGSPWLWTLIGAALLLCCCCCFFCFFLLRRRRREKEKENELSVVQVTLGVPPVEPPISPYGLPSSPRGGNFSMASLGSRVLELRRELSGALPAEEQAVSTPLMEETVNISVPQQMMDLDVPSPASAAGAPPTPASLPESPHNPQRATSGHDMRI